MKMNKPEKDTLEEVAQLRGLSSAMLVRMLVADEARRLGTPPPAQRRDS
jgi:hypothetical protein